jgi:putative phage-type endonuclease
MSFKKMTMVVKRSVPLENTFQFKNSIHIIKKTTFTEEKKIEEENSEKYARTFFEKEIVLKKSFSIEEIIVNNENKIVSNENNFFHNCIYDLLIDNALCKICNKKFENGIPVLPEDCIKSKEFCENRIEEFKNRSMTEQKSDAWLNARYECITASVVAKITNKLESKTVKDMILEKAHYGKYSKYVKNIYTTYGELYEPLANMVYCFRTGRTTYDYGLIKHPEYYFIGASTDGVTDDLINIEIKCPTSRVVDGHISKLYYEQMQLQMEVLDLDITHFFECNFITHQREEFILLETEHEKGIIIEYLDYKQNVCYSYSPMELHKFNDEIIEWQQNEINNLIKDNIITESIYWSLKRVNCNEVKRDKKWFENKLPLLKKFWSRVEEERKKEVLDSDDFSGVCMI